MKNIQSPTLLDYLGLIFLSAIWGSSFIGIEIALEGTHPFFIAFGRIFMASLFLYAIVFFKGLSLPKDTSTWTILIFVGILNNSIPFYLISWGQQYINASTASIMLAVGPFIALILSHYITHDEKFTLLKLIGVILGFLGVFVLLGDDLIAQNHDSVMGELAMLGATVGYISSGLLLRKVHHLNTIVCSGSMLFTGWLFMAPFLFLLPQDNFHFTSNSFLWIVYLAIVPTAFASLIRVRLVQKVGVQFMSQVAYMIPIFAIFWAWVAFEEVPKASAFIALALVLLGLFIRKLKR